MENSIDDTLSLTRDMLSGIYPYRVYGKVNQVVGLVI